ncbi:MAG: high-affinity nickel-transporter [Rhizobium sp.]|nr:high-affinity nickel-transporter [Rhizobium sp.]
MWPWIIEFQKEIYLAFAEHIKAFAAGTGWTEFLTFLPMGIAFGSVHAMTPGHSKTVLATYLAGASSGMWRALLVSLSLSFTHVTMSVLIVLLSLPLVSVMFGGNGPGSSPILENLSRGLLGIIGIWMLWRAFATHGHTHHEREGLIVGVMAGLIPCPLTLFVMTFSITRGVPGAGIMFAVVMMIGVAITLSVVALSTVFFRDRMMRLFTERPRLIANVSKVVEVLAGLVLVALAVREIALRWLRKCGIM